MGIGGAVSAAKSSNDLMQKQISEQQEQLKQKRQALFGDELETLKSSGQAHFDNTNNTNNTNKGAF